MHAKLSPRMFCGCLLFGFAVCYQVYPTSAGDVAVRFEVILGRYSASMNKAATPMLRFKRSGILDERNQDLLHLLSEKSASFADSSDDLAALAAAAELLKLREDCIHYSWRAVETNCVELSAYPPLLRSLLSLGRMAEAEHVLSLGEQSVSANLFWSDIRYRFYLKYRSLRANDLAMTHLQSCLQRLRSEPLSLGAVATAIARLRDCEVFVVQQAGSNGWNQLVFDFEATRQTWLTSVTEQSLDESRRGAVDGKLSQLEIVLSLKEGKNEKSDDLLSQYLGIVISNYARKKTDSALAILVDATRFYDSSRGRFGAIPAIKQVKSLNDLLDTNSVPLSHRAGVKYVASMLKRPATFQPNLK